MEEENQRLKDNIEALAAEKVALKREIAHLEQVNEELGENSPGLQPMPGYLNDSGGAQSGYTALTSHSLAVSQPVSVSGELNQPAAPKKSKKRRRKKGGSRPNPSSQGGGLL